MKTLSRLQISAVLSLVALFCILPQNIGYASLSAFVVFVSLTTWTFYVMYQIAYTHCGPRYARKNLTLAIGFTFIFGLGLMLWPYLIQTEIRKSQKIEI